MEDLSWMLDLINEPKKRNQPEIRGQINLRKKNGYEKSEH
jgi:hypothetical protein